jgi:hypothetical protein
MNTASHLLRPAILALSVLISCALHAEVYIVSSPADSGPSTLRQTIIEAGQNTTDDVIVFNVPHVVAGAFGADYSITLTSGELTPVANSGTLTIDASEVRAQLPPSSILSIRASGGRILSNPAGSTLTLINIGLRDGDGTGAAQTGTGGAILNLGTLTLTNCTLSGNSTTGSNSGGAISNQGILTATGCSIHDNTASGNGSGIANATNGVATLTNCTIANNQQTGSTQGGGGINHSATAISLSIIHCTVSGNSATGSDGGGGLRVKGNSVTLRNSIIHGNTSPSATSASDLLHDGSITKSGNNIIGANAGSIAMLGSAHSSTAPNLDALGDHGGPVPTMPPLDGSPAIEGVAAVNEAAGVTTDGRGAPRLIDGDGNGTALADIGAVEFIPASALVVRNASDTGPGSLRDTVLIAAVNPGADMITFATGFTGPIVFGSLIDINDTAGVTIDASAVTAGVTLDGNQHRHFFVHSGSIVTLRGLTLANGHADTGVTVGGNIGFFGGAIANDQGTLTLTQCTLSGNSANGGGAIINASGTLTLAQCTLSGNSANGGGAIINASGTLTLAQCTLSGNSTDGRGGAISNSYGTATLTNCIVAGNTAADPFGQLFSDNISGSFTGTNNLTSGNPMLAPLGDYGGPTQTMPPQFGSPAIDAGAVVPGITTDQRGVRLSFDGNGDGNAAPDIGAVEYLPSPIVVTSNADTGSGTLRSALAAAAIIPGADTITFVPSLSGQTISLTSADPGDSFSGIQINDSGGVTVDASALPGGLTIDDGTSTSYRLFAVTPGSSLSLIGLTLANGGGSGFNSIGGAIYNDQGTLTLTQCTLSENSAPGVGGAIYNDSATLTLAQCTLSGNSAGTGGAIFNASGTLMLTQCTLSGNSAGYGGAIFNLSGTLTLTQCTLSGNSADSGGGAIYNGTATLMLTNCIAAGNTPSNIVGSFTPNGNNLTSGNPLLAPLGDYGGPTQTMPPQPGSPAIEGVAPANVVPGLTTDQRGVPFRDGNANGIVSPDIGAAEADVIVVTTAADENDTPATLGGGVSLREAVRDVTPGGVIMFDPALFNGSTPAANTITLTLGPLNPQVNCTLDASTCPAPISVVHQPTIYQQPQSLVVAPGSQALFSVSVANVSGGINPQWRINGTDLAGQTNFVTGLTPPAGASGVLDVVLSEAVAPGTLTLNNIFIGGFSAISQPATISAGNLPVLILRQPVSAMLPVGGSTTLSVIATGPPPPQPVLKYQWYKAGKAIAGATKSSYAITNAQLTSAAAYNCVVSSGFTSVASSTAEIGVVDTRPKTVNLAPGKKFVPTVLAAGNGLSFAWSKNNAALVPAQTAKSFSINTVATTDEGLYTCAVSGLAGTLNNGFNTQLNVINGAPVLGTLAPPNAVITQQYFYQIPEAAPTTNRKATSFSVTGLPPGLKCDASTGLISGRPTATKTGGYALTIKATNLKGSDTKTATLTVIGMPPPALGTFTGYIPRSSLNDNLGGRIDLTTTASGACSGSITLGGQPRRPFKNQLIQSYGNSDALLTAHVAGVKMPDGTPLFVTIDLNVPAGSAQLTLTHPDGTQLLIPAWRNPWSKTSPATAFATPYALRLDGGTGAGAPEGFGFCTFTVASAGTVRLAGKLPDGSALIGSTFVGAGGEVMVFQLLYGKKGSLVGSFTLTPQSPVTDNSAAGTLDWMKPAQPVTSKDTIYKAGFGPLGVAVDGGAYVAPPAGQRVLDLPAEVSPATNAKLAFTLGGLDVAGPEFDQPLRIDNPKPTGLTNIAKIETPVNATRVTSLNAATGAFAGSFVIPGASTALNRPAAFQGQIVCIGGTTQGYGFFLLPQVPTGSEKVSTAPKLSGVVKLLSP